MTQTPVQPEPTEQPHPGRYLPEPEYDSPQDDGDTEAGSRGFLGATLVTTHPMAPRDFPEALDWCANQSVHRLKDWTGRCQEFCRTAPGCGPGASSALDAWFGMPDAARHVGGNPEDAPTGAVLFSHSHNPDSLSSRFGHVIYGARPFANGNQGAWSTDALRQGWPDKINPSDLYARWGHEFLGWGEWENGLWLHLKEPKVKPVQDQRYVKLGASLVDADRVLVKLRAARDRAKELKDWKDRDRIIKLIEHQSAVKKEIAQAFAELRHVA
jgi:hypothetical protein